MNLKTIIAFFLLVGTGFAASPNYPAIDITGTATLKNTVMQNGGLVTGGYLNSTGSGNITADGFSHNGVAAVQAIINSSIPSAPAENAAWSGTSVLLTTGTTYDAAGIMCPNIIPPTSGTGNWNLIYWGQADSTSYHSVACLATSTTGSAGSWTRQGPIAGTYPYVGGTSYAGVSRGVQWPYAFVSGTTCCLVYAGNDSDTDQSSACHMYRVIGPDWKHLGNRVELSTDAVYGIAGTTISGTDYIIYLHGSSSPIGNFVRLAAGNIVAGTLSVVSNELPFNGLVNLPTDSWGGNLPNGTNGNGGVGWTPATLKIVNGIPNLWMHPQLDPADDNEINQTVYRFVATDQTMLHWSCANGGNPSLNNGNVGCLNTPSTVLDTGSGCIMAIAKGDDLQTGTSFWEFTYSGSLAAITGANSSTSGISTFNVQAAVSGSTSLGTGATAITFATPSINIGNQMSTTQWTVPVSGNYLAGMRFSIPSVSGTGLITAYAWRTSDSATNYFFGETPLSGKEYDPVATVPITANAGDIWKFYFYNGAATNQTANSINLWIYKLP